MFRLKNIVILALVIITFGIAWRYYKKYKNSGKLKVGEISLTPTKKLKTFDDLVDIFKDGLKLKGFVSIRNFSSNKYTLNQLNLDCFSPETEKLIAEQTNIMQNNIVLTAKQSTNIPLEYKVDILNTLSLFKESKVIPEEYTVWKIISNPTEAFENIKIKNLKIKLKGFIEAEGITIPINEIVNLYE